MLSLMLKDGERFTIGTSRWILQRSVRPRHRGEDMAIIERTDEPKPNQWVLRYGYDLTCQVDGLEIRLQLVDVRPGRSRIGFHADRSLDIQHEKK